MPLITVLQQEIVTLTAASGMALDLAIVIRRAGSVLNSNNFPLEEGYDDNLYTFAPAKALTIPVEAAKHNFGWDERAPGKYDAMTRVAAADGTPGGWAVVIVEAGRSYVRKVAALSDSSTVLWIPLRRF